jgi:4-phytase / acid phosphatase
MIRKSTQMRARTRLHRLLCVLLALLGLPGMAVAADVQPQGDLQLVIVLSRHGVRSPTAEPGSLDAFASNPWPNWPVQPGFLTPHGKQLMRIMGGWYRAYYARAGLVPAQGCPAASSLFVVADDEQRTMESAHGLLEGFAPGCQIAIQASPKHGQQALFAHDFSNASDADRAEAAAAVMGRVGADPARLASANAGLLEQMQAALFGCQPEACDPSHLAGKKWLRDQNASIEPSSGDGLLSIKSPLHIASTFAENFFLEYVEGMPMADVAWGRVTPLQLGQLLSLHAIYSDISLRTPVIARAYAGNLAKRILTTLQQSSSSQQGKDAIGTPQAKMIFLVGHDTNIETLAGLLDVHWMLAEQPADPTSTGGALVFELRRVRQSGRYEVSAYYVSQSMEQMRNSSALDWNHPPVMAPIFIPGCSEATTGYACQLNQFARLVEEKIK